MHLEPSQYVPAPVAPYLLPYERNVITVRKHPAILLGPVSLSLASILTAGLLTAGVIHANGTTLGIAWGVCIALLLLLLFRVASWSATFVVVTSTRMMLLSGLVVRKVAMMPLATITDMSYRRRLPGRLFGYATFVVESGGEYQTLQTINYMPYPEQLYLELCELLFPAGTDEGTQEPEPEDYD